MLPPVGIEPGIPCVYLGMFNFTFFGALIDRDLQTEIPLDSDPLDRDPPPRQRPPSGHVTCCAFWDRDPL